MNMPVEQDLSAVVQRLRMSDVSYFECEGPDFLIRLHFARRPEKSDIRAVPPPPARPGNTAPAGILRSPGMGMLLLSHPLSALAALKEGDQIAGGQLVALLRVGELLTPVLATSDAVVSRVIGQEGALTGYGDALFELASL